jgi:hypothetical protein
MMVTVLIGKLKTSPEQVHIILCLLNTPGNTPTILTVITTRVTVVVKSGSNPVRNAMPNASSVKAYT